MSGTNAGLTAKDKSALVLPSPKLQLYKPVDADLFFVSEGPPSAGGLKEVTIRRRVKLTFPGLPSEVIDNVALYEPKLELLRFTKSTSRENDSVGNGFKTSGYVHPSDAPAGNSGSFTHGGRHGGVHPDTVALRITEWNITTSGQYVDVTQSVLAFMCYLVVPYRDNTGNVLTLQSVTAATCSNHYPAPGNRFPYSRRYGAGYFAFRLSIKDLGDARLKRMHGPVSERLICGSHYFPFEPAGVDFLGRAQATVSNQFSTNDTNLNFWINQRVPGGQ